MCVCARVYCKTGWGNGQLPTCIKSHTWLSFISLFSLFEQVPPLPVHFFGNYLLLFSVEKIFPENCLQLNEPDYRKLHVFFCCCFLYLCNLRCTITKTKKIRFYLFYSNLKSVTTICNARTVFITFSTFCPMTHFLCRTMTILHLFEC